MMAVETVLGPCVAPDASSTGDRAPGGSDRLISNRQIFALCRALTWSGVPYDREPEPEPGTMSAAGGIFPVILR